jgi:hypothetical protein
LKATGSWSYLLFFIITQVLIMMKEIIRDEAMFDQRNPAIILCSPDLEAALNMKALHVTEIRYLHQCVSSKSATVPDI